MLDSAEISLKCAAMEIPCFLAGKYAGNSVLWTQCDPALREYIFTDCPDKSVILISCIQSRTVHKKLVKFRITCDLPICSARTRFYGENCIDFVSRKYIGWPTVNGVKALISGQRAFTRLLFRNRFYRVIARQYVSLV